MSVEAISDIQGLVELYSPYVRHLSLCFRQWRKFWQAISSIFFLASEKLNHIIQKDKTLFGTSEYNATALAGVKAREHSAINSHECSEWQGSRFRCFNSFCSRISVMFSIHRLGSCCPTTVNSRQSGDWRFYPEHRKPDPVTPLLFIVARKTALSTNSYVPSFNQFFPPANGIIWLSSFTQLHQAYFEYLNSMIRAKKI